ncbi:MAG: hypothetical protein ITG02_14595 [Patulibacter sp.]|nr:hypothetical protein [Patulibacter sp.]
MPSITVTPVLAAADTGYIVAAVVVSAVVLIAYLWIVAVRVRNASVQLDELEQRLDRLPVDEPAAAPPEVASR